jgi:hypothetical protein
MFLELPVVDCGLRSGLIVGASVVQFSVLPDKLLYVTVLSSLREIVTDSLC